MSDSENKSTGYSVGIMKNKDVTIRKLGGKEELYILNEEVSEFIETLFDALNSDQLDLLIDRIGEKIDEIYWKEENEQG